MARPTKHQAAATAMANRARQEWLESLYMDGRVCPATEHRAVQMWCGDCQAHICTKLAEVGLDEQGVPLPMAQRPLCGARTRDEHPCRKPIVPGKRRCRFHGGMSTGPKTAEGRSRIAEAQRQRWLKARTGHS